MTDDEGQVEERGQDTSREGECRILRAGKTTSASAGHYEPTGQGVDHSTDDQLSEDESRLSGRSDTHVVVFQLSGVSYSFYPL